MLLDSEPKGKGKKPRKRRSRKHDVNKGNIEAITEAMEDAVADLLEDDNAL